MVKNFSFSGKIKFTLCTPYNTIETIVTGAEVVTSGGTFFIGVDRDPIISLLRKATIILELEDGRKRSVKVLDGLISVRDNMVTVISGNSVEHETGG